MTSDPNMRAAFRITKPATAPAADEGFWVDYADGCGFAFQWGTDVNTIFDDHRAHHARLSPED